MGQGLRENLSEQLTSALAAQDLARVGDALSGAAAPQVVAALERLTPRQRAIAFRLLPKDVAAEVFEDFPPALQSDLVGSLRDAEVATIFAELEPDDRVWLLDELPASLAPR